MSGVFPSRVIEARCKTVTTSTHSTATREAYLLCAFSYLLCGPIEHYLYHGNTTSWGVSGGGPYPIMSTKMQEPLRHNRCRKLSVWTISYDLELIQRQFCRGPITVRYGYLGANLANTLHVPRAGRFRVSLHTEKTMYPFSFPLNGIWFWNKLNSIWFKIKRKTVTTIISH